MFVKGMCVMMCQQFYIPSPKTAKCPKLNTKSSRTLTILVIKKVIM